VGSLASGQEDVHQVAATLLPLNFAIQRRTQTRTLVSFIGSGNLSSEGDQYHLPYEQTVKPVALYREENLSSLEQIYR
jgi:hypothetical protein